MRVGQFQKSRKLGEALGFRQEDVPSFAEAALPGAQSLHDGEPTVTFQIDAVARLAGGAERGPFARGGLSACCVWIVQPAQKTVRQTAGHDGAQNVTVASFEQLAVPASQTW